MNIVLEVNKMNENDVDELYNLINNHQGNSKIFFHLYDELGENKKFYSRKLKVSNDDKFINKLKSIYGEENIWIE
mgnify:FL=1